MDKLSTGDFATIQRMSGISLWSCFMMALENIYQPFLWQRRSHDSEQSSAVGNEHCRVLSLLVGNADFLTETISWRNERVICSEKWWWSNFFILSWGPGGGHVNCMVENGIITKGYKGDVHWKHVFMFSPNFPGRSSTSCWVPHYQKYQGGWHFVVIFFAFLAYLILRVQLCQKLFFCWKLDLQPEPTTEVIKATLESRISMRS